MADTGAAKFDDEEALCEGFAKCCSFGGGSGGATKDTATTANVTKWFKNAKVYDKKLTTTDTDIGFTKVKDKGAKEINYAQFLRLCDELKNKTNVNKMKTKLAQQHIGATGVTKISKTGGVAKMTDASQYTGAHKERFNADGSGKGIEGRVDRDDKASEGYVGGYKGKDTYDGKK